MNDQIGNEATNLPDKAGRMVVYEKDATAELHASVEKYASKVHLEKNRSLTKSQAIVELLKIALHTQGLV